MGEETIGHYASHPGGGYQPTKTDKPKAQNPPTGSGVPVNPDPEILKELMDMLKNKKDSEFYTITHATPVAMPSDIELKIRKDVMARINKSLDIAMNGHCCDDIIEAMEDVRLMLNLLWGE